MCVTSTLYTQQQQFENGIVNLQLRTQTKRGQKSVNMHAKLHTQLVKKFKKVVPCDNVHALSDSKNVSGSDWSDVLLKK